MKKAQLFETYFNDIDLGEEKLARMKLTRQLVHEIYPDVKERVAYAKAGFYPKDATKATEQFFLLTANKGWLGLYGIWGLEEKYLTEFNQHIEIGKGSLRVSYSMPEPDFKKLLTIVIAHNGKLQGLDF